MLGLGLFALFWIVLGVGFFLVAIRGGRGGAAVARRAPTQAARRIGRWSFLVVYVGFGVAIPLLILTGNHANADKRVGQVKLTPAESQGRLLFGQHCGVCHTLAAANATGKVGPNLDQLQPPATLVYNTIINGCVQNPPPGSPEACLGYGTMPAMVIEPEDAKKVAAFVAKVAGKE
jgi:mono/diheme cytochrome c family protein